MTHKQRVTRAVYAVYVVLVAAFVASSIFQVARRVFDPRASADVKGTIPAGVGAECGRALAEAIGAMDTARIAASRENGADAARSRYTSAPHGPAPAALEERCRADGEATEALAALARFDRAAEAQAVRDASELSPVRLAAQSFIRGHDR
jgi:hypothetical protein